MTRKVLSVLLAATMLVSLSACSGGTTASTTAAATSAATAETKAPDAAATTAAAADTNAVSTDSAEPIKMGCPQPLTGTNAMVGDSAVKGAQLAVEEVNAAGGINGRPIELIVYDDQASPEEAVKIATKMLEVDKVDLICGSLISSCVLSAGQYYDEAGIPCLGTGLSPTWMQQGWKYVWRACPNSGMAMVPLANYIKELGMQNVAIFQGQDDSSASNADAFREAAKTAGLNITTSETYVEGDTDYSGQVAKIVGTNPDCVFNSTFSTTQSAFAKQLRQFGYEGIVFNKETLSADNIRVAGDAANLWAFLFPYITYTAVEDDTNPNTKPFTEAFYAKYNEMPYHDCAYRAYDSVKVLAEAANKAGTVEGKAVIEALGTINNYPGLGGTYDFTRGDQEGIHEENFSAWIIQDMKPMPFDDWKASGAYDALKK